MRLQGTGGALLFNVSKQAINPGVSSARTACRRPLPCCWFASTRSIRPLRHPGQWRQCRSHPLGLLTPKLIASRASSRGLSEKAYMSGNLLGREVTPADVAQAFLHQALALKTTAHITTVDGGNIAAALR